MVKPRQRTETKLRRQAALVRPAQPAFAVERAATYSGHWLTSRQHVRGRQRLCASGRALRGYRVAYSLATGRHANCLLDIACRNMSEWPGCAWLRQAVAPATGKVHSLQQSGASEW